MNDAGVEELAGHWQVIVSSQQPENDLCFTASSMFSSVIGLRYDTLLAPQ